MKDYRLTENRREYFDALYGLNLSEKIMPGLVYLYMPALKEHFNWDTEQSLFFAFLNGLTQNPLTSLRLLERVPMYSETNGFQEWFDETWPKLNFDTDRRHQKRDTPKAIECYANLATQYGSQEKMLLGRSFDDVWNFVSNNFYSFGRLATWSYLEYVFILAGGEDATTLFLEDKSGSKSHRNGLLFLTGQDHLVHDKRLDNGFDGKYSDFKNLCKSLEGEADKVIARVPGASRFTLESNLCTTKNHYFCRRYPGVYSDMAYDRLKKYEKDYGSDNNTRLFWEIREQLPDWLRLEIKHDGLSIKERAAFFVNTGYPYRGEHFLS